jgi:hypothetical protein
MMKPGMVVVSIGFFIVSFALAVILVFAVTTCLWNYGPATCMPEVILLVLAWGWAASFSRQSRGWRAQPLPLWHIGQPGRGVALP